jgi:hypothetical protein
MDSLNASLTGNVSKTDCYDRKRDVAPEPMGLQLKCNHETPNTNKIKHVYQLFSYANSDSVIDKILIYRKVN